MTFALVLFWDGPSDHRLDPAARARLRALLRGVAGLREAAIFTPEAARDAYTSDGAPPLGLQLLFGDLPALERAAGTGGPLMALADGGLPGLPSGQATQQAFVRRTFPVDDPALRTAAGALPCSFVVHYPGPAADLNDWLGHYLADHPALMRRMPGIRGIEVLTRVDWISGLPLPRADHMQRNRVLFDSPAALEAALNSPIRHEMRAHFRHFPPFEGGSAHYPMATDVVTGHDPAD